MKLQFQNVVGGLGLGRMEAPDERDKGFRMHMAGVPPVDTAIRSRKYQYWNANGWWGDQQATPHCVAYATVHMLEDGPVTFKKRQSPMIDPTILYAEAQKRDEWEGEGYDGTSARGAMKYLAEVGIIKSYTWGFSLGEVIAAVLTKGPVLFGQPWYRSMFTPTRLKVDGTERSIININPNSPLDGGHETEINGVNIEEELFRFKNSWGRWWGDGGHAWMRFSDFERLLREGGDACLPVENPEQVLDYHKF